MIVDFRRYTLKPGQLGPYTNLYGSQGYPVQVKHLGPAHGWFVSDVGPQNHVVHLWAYDSLAQMEDRRAVMAADPDWIPVRDAFKGMFAEQETRIMTMVPNLPYTRSAQKPGLADIRIYTVHHGEMSAFLSFMRDEAAVVQARHWPDNIAYLTSHIGTLNQVVHIWGHADHTERLARRQQLLADPDWQGCLKTILPRVARMETFTAVPAAFWQRDPTQE